MPRSSPSRPAGGGDAGTHMQPVPPPALPQQAPPVGLPSPTGITFDTVLVQPEGGTSLTVPRFTLADGRSARRANVTYVPQRYLEMLLFHRTDGGSSGAVYKILNQNGLGATSWVTNTAAVTKDELSQAHVDFIQNKFKEFMPTNSDAILSGRIRNVTLLPIASAAAVCRIRGKSPEAMAFLRACAPSQLPRSWELQAQAEALEEDEVDVVLEDDLAEAEDADADVAFAHELQGGGFASYNATAADETNAREYGLKASEIPANLSREADKYIAFKVEPLEARRASTAVVETTAQSDLNSFYRFLGFLKLKRLIPAEVLHLSLSLLAHPSAADWVGKYLAFMKDERKLAFSSMANYLSSLYSLATFVFDSDDFEVVDAVADASHTVLNACVNLRSQCEALAKEKGLYSEKRGGNPNSSPDPKPNPKHNPNPNTNPNQAGSRGSRRSRRASSVSRRSTPTRVPTRRSRSRC